MSRIARILVSFVSVGLIFIFFVFSFSFLYFLFLNNEINKNKDSFQSSLLHYQEISSSSSNHISTSGFVEINQKFNDYDFISYFNPNSESSIIVSNFADSLFECSVTCLCSNSVRKSSNVLTRSLFIAFSALSSSLALQIATKTFHDQCLHHFSETCDEQNIETEALFCSEREEVDDEIGVVVEEPDFAEYSCKGHCLPKRRIRSPSTIEAQNDFFEKEGKCEELKMTGEIKIERKEGKAKQTHVFKSGKKKIYPNRYDAMNMNARIAFRREYLTNYCKEMSKRSFLYRRPDNGKLQRQTANFCVGSYYRQEYSKNIQCTLTSESKHYTGTDIWEARKRNLRNKKRGE